MFSHMIFYVKDIPTALSYYEAVFGVKTRFIHDSGAYAELDTGSTALAFASEELGAMNLPEGYQKHSTSAPPLGSEVVFTVDDVERTFSKAIERGGTALVEPTEKPWGQRVAYVQDPNGILIEIASPIGT